MNYTQKKIVKQWKKLLAEIEITEDFIKINNNGKGTKFRIPKESTQRNTKNISYK